ncbi:1-acyl-sn-glycerol-3-phosphate acyltransferase BAT2, chloroplastic isoform X1 [Cryptomeria japonica]|uniref:1-acyl-sn-glycerol-3-phosphate acyltransferase BAT2, chloroplastic isoform X1 n=1 Tax=Cryptomeria japonica TaxID=3369 RepID=UPI0027D9F319|nr:1-acyl-sn-glycerol-3-phosphate acyltransferase BAT2, chloroplastic isoform X1 [Cryptomeria japonica]
MMGLALRFHPIQLSNVGATPVQHSYLGAAPRQIAAAATSITIPFNFNFFHNVPLNGTAKIALGIQCHMNCLGGSQILLQRKNGLFGFRQYTSVIKEKQGTHRIALCHVAGGANPGLPSSTVYDASLGPKLRAIVFYIVNCIVAIPLFVVMLAAHPFVLLFDKYRRKIHHLINKAWASLSLLLLYKVDIEGLQNLPPPDAPAVYVSNHQSYLDVYVLLLLGRSFKFISKTSIFLIPIIGWAMFMTGHIPLRRMDNKSQMECLKRCLNVLKHGASVHFFPEGTRPKDGKLSTFKKGAFSMAAKARVPVVPITLIGTGEIMPNGMEGTLRPGSIKIIVNQPIEGTNADELSNKARSVIAQQLVMHGNGVH